MADQHGGFLRLQLRALLTAFPSLIMISSSIAGDCGILMPTLSSGISRTTFNSREWEKWIRTEMTHGLFLKKELTLKWKMITGTRIQCHSRFLLRRIERVMIISL